MRSDTVERRRTWGAGQVGTWLALGLLPLAVPAQERVAEPDEVEGTWQPVFEAARPHHLSIVLGLTDVEGEESGFTAGVDYEYRVNRRLGLGAVAERAFDDVEATTLLAVADLHLVRGLALQTGPGVELLDARQALEDGQEGEGSDTRFVYRVGLLYEFELGGQGLTVSPQLHYDWVPGAGADSYVLALAFGRAF